MELIHSHAILASRTAPIENPRETRKRIAPVADRKMYRIMEIGMGMTPISKSEAFARANARKPEQNVTRDRLKADDR